MVTFVVFGQNFRGCGSGAKSQPVIQQGIKNSRMKSPAMHVVVLHVAGDNRQETAKEPQEPASPEANPLHHEAEGQDGEKEKRPPISLVAQERLR